MDSEIAKRLLEWLGYDGVFFFEMLMEKYGRINCLWMEGGIPHPVHFREGMAVRNQLRKIRVDLGVESNDAHWYDDNWTRITKLALDLCAK